MTWIKLDDKCPRHPKVAGLSDRAFRCWVQAMCYASEFLTDGLIPSPFLRTVPAKCRAELVANGLWFVRDEEMHIHDYLVHQSSREYVETERAFSTRRHAMNRDPELRVAIQKRDGSTCRYCACTVSWTDRRGPRGATYDHIIPRGPETLDNLVVSCRKCNARKASRTPDEAGMVLLEPRSKPRFHPDKPEPKPIPENREQRSDTEKNQEQHPALRASFETLWTIYPRKVGKDAALAQWLRIRPDAALAAEMVAAVERQSHSPQWRKDHGQFIPHARTWLSQGRWKDSVDLVVNTAEVEADAARAEMRRRASERNSRPEFADRIKAS